LTPLGECAMLFAAEEKLIIEARRIAKIPRNSEYEPIAGRGLDMATNTVAQMTPGELRDMLESVIENAVEQKLVEILGDPDEGLEIRETVRDRLLLQREAVISGECGQPFEKVEVYRSR
jgi:hypothetical protein